MTDNELFGNSEQLDDLISRQAAIDAIDRYYKDKRYITRSRTILSAICRDMKSTMDSLPSAPPEPLTDKEQRIFLAAMEREEKVCKEVDRNYVREPYEDSLMRVCKEIRRKVKGALWT